MKESRSLKGSELPEDVLEAIEDARINLANVVIEEYDNRLHKTGKCLDMRDKERVHEQLMFKMSVKLDMSVSLDGSVLDDVGVAPRDMSQTEIQSFGRSK